MERKKKKEVKPHRDEDLCKWIQDGELYARDLLIRQNLKFIKKIAGSFVINPWIGLDRDDLVQIGSIAMVDAAKSYDPNHGAKFETFMTPVLKNAMTDLIREHQKGFEFRAIDPEGTLNFQLLRIDDEIPDSNGQTIAEFVRDTGVIHPESREIRRESIAEIHKALNTIPEAQRMYLCYRLGFGEDDTPHSMEDTAKHFGFTLGYARTFEEEAVDNTLLELPWWYEEADWFPIRFIPE